MPAERTCPRCGTALALDALEGLCPTCVGRAVFAEDSAISGVGEEAADGAAPAPNIEAELARLKPEEAGEWIGPYKLMEQIGQGGFGTVWVADQERPVRRRVALKIIKLGMDTKEVMARFEQERQALAMMDHPHIAKVFDAGATKWGRPYFVMELVRGIKITDYCDQANLPTVSRLELFIQVCSAVQHAHQKGIIHRDLKPSNILVTLHDGDPVPKVIDFGVAKATQQQRLTDLTIYTQFEQMIGTPLYMSPEQAEMSGLDIDTRSDIYSLGVLLYELLTGRTPFDPQELMRKGYDEIRRAIREEEPQTPSMFLQTMADATRATVAQHRQADPAKLAKLVRGDLDWIVMKALEKDRTRRYETANGLAKDIQRHLSNEPVNARPASQFYRLRRLVRRNRVTFAAASAVAAALIVGLSVAIYSFLNERTARAGETKQREIAEERSRQAQTSAAEATASELKARRFLYAADMNLVQQALRSNNIGLARVILDRHRPGIGEQDLRGWEWRYLWQECRSGAQVLLTKREGHTVFSASFSPDGTLLLAGYNDGKVELWDAAARRLRKIVQPRCGQIARVAFSPDGRTFAALTERQTVKTFHIETGAETLICTLPGAVRDLSYSRDGEWLAVLTVNPDFVTLRRANDGGVIMDLPLPKDGGAFFNNVRMSPDKQRLYVSCGAFAKPNLRCLTIPDAGVIWENHIGVIDDSDENGKSDIGFSAMDLSPDGHTLVVATGVIDRQLRVLESASGRLLQKLSGHTGFVLQIAFSPDGSFLASTSQDQTVRLWDTATWRRRAAPLRGHNHEVNALAISNATHLVASGNKEGELLLWDTQIRRPA
ncbi:MAG TPA: serine/threonine-protein kinase, partial [Chthoniobacteraceae bacterium]|nr:serine/threonine-protein kinase [Chthoniobacteraceae bacterium]